MSFAHVNANSARTTARTPASSAVVHGMDPLGVEGMKLTFSRNEEIFGEGEPAKCTYRVLSGVVRTYRILSDGRRQISEFLLPGDVFGLELDGEHRLSAEAVGDCEVIAMRRCVLSAAAERDVTVAGKLWSLTLHNLRRAEDHMLLLGRKTAAERLAWFLMDMAARIPAHDQVDLPMSRQDIADYLGLTIETVSRTMTQLHEEGVIDLPSCRRIAFTNRRALLDLAA